MPKHVQIQFFGRGDEWHAAGDVEIRPDGLLSWSDNRFVEREFLRVSFFSPDEGRELTIAEPEKYFDAWIRFGGNQNFRVIDMDAAAADVLPQAEWPRASAAPESIKPEPEAAGIET